MRARRQKIIYRHTTSTIAPVRPAELEVEEACASAEGPA